MPFLAHSCIKPESQTHMLWVSMCWTDGQTPIFSCSGFCLHSYSHATNIQAPMHQVGATEHPSPCLGCPGPALKCGSYGPWDSAASHLVSRTSSHRTGPGGPYTFGAGCPVGIWQGRDLATAQPGTGHLGACVGSASHFVGRSLTILRLGLLSLGKMGQHAPPCPLPGLWE